MKRIISTILVMTMILSLTACGGKVENEEPTTVGGILLADFKGTVSENAEITAQELADKVLANEIIPFMGATMPVEQGLLTGFGNTEITGFKEGVMFAPNIGTIPFVGYVFILEDEVEPESFVKTLQDNADPRWNICTEAEETVADYVDNKVFFVMCPAQFETEETDTEATVETGSDAVVEVIEPEQTEVESNTSSYNPEQDKPAAAPEQNSADNDITDSKPAETEKEEPKKEEVKEEVKEETKEETLGQTLLADFNNRVTDSSLTAQQLADALITNEAILFMGGTVPVEPGWLSGFSADITGFKEGVSFGPMMGSIAFIGYVFELEEGSDVEAFMETLKSNADPRWQICVEAEETIVASAGNKVFFLMCPRGLEQ